MTNRFSKKKLNQYLQDAYESQTKRFDYATNGLSAATKLELQLNNPTKKMYDILTAEVANGNMTVTQMVEVISVLALRLDHEVMGYNLELDS